MKDCFILYLISKLSCILRQKYQNQYPYNHGRESRLNCPDVTALNSQYQPDPMSHMQYKPLREKNGSFALQSTAVISEVSRAQNCMILKH